MLSLLDFLIIGIVAVSLGVGMFRGFVREVLSLSSWVGAIWVSYTYVMDVAVLLTPYIEQPPLRVVAAFAGLFVFALIVFSLLGYLIYRLIAVAGISGIDRSLGLLFGIARGCIIVSIMIMVATFMDFNSQPWWKGSLLVNYFDPVTDMIRSLLPEEVATFV